MAESKIVVKDNHLLFEDGRFYVTETPYKDGRQTDFPKKIDVTDEVVKAVTPKQPAINTEDSVWPKEIIDDTVREAAENTDKVLDELGLHPLFKAVYNRGYKKGKDETLKKVIEWLQVYCSMYFRLDVDPKKGSYCIKSDIAQLLSDLYNAIEGE